MSKASEHEPDVAADSLTNDIASTVSVAGELGCSAAWVSEMVKRKDNRSRKEAVDRWKVDQRAIARAKLPLSNDQMQALFDMLDVEFPRQGCNRTLRLTRAWLVSNGLPVAPVIVWLQDDGGYCDCEALANAEEAWRNAIQDVNW